MIKQIKRFIADIFSDDLSVEVQRMHTMLLAGLGITVYIALLRFIEGAAPITLWVQAIAFVGILGSMVGVTKVKTFKIPNYITVITLNFIYFPFQFFLAGGLTSSTITCFVMGVVIAAMLFKGRERVVFLLLTLIAYCVCLASSYFLPDSVTYPMGADYAADIPDFSYIDALGCFIAIGAFLAVVIGQQDRVYRSNRARLQALSEQNERRAVTRGVINDVAAELMRVHEDKFMETFDSCLGRLATSIGTDTASVWRIEGEGDELRYIPVYEYSCFPLEGQATVLYYNDRKQWFDELSKDRVLHGNYKELSLGGIEIDAGILSEASGITIDEAKTVIEGSNHLFIPVYAAEGLNGFLAFRDSTGKHIFTKDEIELMRSGSLIIYNAYSDYELKLSYIAAREQAQAGEKAKTAFLSNMSHEMRTPLNAIIGMNTLAKNTDEIDKIKYYQTRIDEASAHLLGIINDVLDMSKIEADSLELSIVDFSVDDMVYRVKNIFRELASSKKIDLDIEISEGFPTCLTGDDQRILQVVTNLLSNAIKFTDEGGFVNVDAVAEESAEGDYIVTVTVEDNGIGISEEQKGRLFKVFSQADSSTSRNYGGTGLGLTISRRIAEAMGGSLDVESTPGEGSKFIFVFRAGKPMGAEPAPAPEVSEPAGDIESLRGKRVLLAEDIDLNAEIVIAFLEDLGISAEHASNGSVAFEKYKSEPGAYDLIFMDVQMPVMDGMDATRAIRASGAEGAKTIPIIAMTANVFKEDIEKCVASGMDDHVGKPIIINELKRVLLKYISG